MWLKLSCFTKIKSEDSVFRSIVCSVGELCVKNHQPKTLFYPKCPYFVFFKLYCTDLFTKLACFFFFLFYFSADSIDLI